ncbi:MAG: hypothetical protein F4Z28_15760 [Gammaproteobacteria bacterium]|nr:hypothetical protein [Gammaproteobacteria bacterium]
MGRFQGNGVMDDAFEHLAHAEASPGDIAHRIRPERDRAIGESQTVRFRVVHGDPRLQRIVAEIVQ